MCSVLGVTNKNLPGAGGSERGGRISSVECAVALPRRGRRRDSQINADML